MCLSLIRNIPPQLKNYTRLRQHNPELHDNINPMRLISLGEDDVVSVAPFKDQHQRRIMFYKIGKWQPARMSINDILAATLLLLELGSLEPVSQVLGGIGIFDFDAYSMSQVWHINPSVVQKIIALMVVGALHTIYCLHKALQYCFPKTDLRASAHLRDPHRQPRMGV